MTELPICRHRGAEIKPNCFQCSSPRLIHICGCATAQTCQQCSIANHKTKIGTNIINFAKAIIKYILSKKASLTKKEYLARIAICATCQYCDKTVSRWQCKICQCYLKKGVLAPGKAQWETENCPINKWPQRRR